MNLNPFLAALGGAFRGAAVDQEMQRRLQAAEEERQRIARAEARQAVLDQRQTMLDDRQLREMEQAAKYRDLNTALQFRKEGYVPLTAMQDEAQTAGLPTGPMGLPENLARVVELAKTKATGDTFALPSGQALGYDPEADPKVQDLRRAEALAAIQQARDEAKARSQSDRDRVLEEGRDRRAAASISAQDARFDRRMEKMATGMAKPPSSTVQQEYLTHKTLKTQAEKALAMLDANKDAVGFWKGVGMAIPGEPTNRSVLGANQANVATRAKLGDIGSLQIRERSGAAVTASEAPRFKPFIPTIGDDYETTRTKLLGLIQRADEVMQTADEEYGGFFSTRSGQRKGGTAPTSGADLVRRNRR